MGRIDPLHKAAHVQKSVMFGVKRGNFIDAIIRMRSCVRIARLIIPMGCLLLTYVISHAGVYGVSTFEEISTQGLRVHKTVAFTRLNWSL